MKEIYEGFFIFGFIKLPMNDERAALGEKSWGSLKQYFRYYPFFQ